jgi:dTDP-4-amino-4,6-dideoxygalactose transaminase
MKVDYLNLQKQFTGEDLWAVLRKQFETCQFVLGPEVEKFESNFARLCCIPFAVGLNSGTDAIFLALKALGIASGDEVITVPNSFVATAGAIMATGARPVFVDVGPDYNINVELIERAITKKTKAILPVHLTGNPAEMHKIMEISQRRTLYVVEDAAQAVGASIDGQPVGSFGDIGCFSLHPLKNLNVCGDGGVLTTGSKEIYEKVRLLRNHGLKNRDEIEFFGYNSRLDTIQAAIANHFITNLKSLTEKRRSNAQIYDSELKDLYNFITLPPRKNSVYQVFHTYVIQAKNRDKLINYLNRHGVETKIHYPIPIHLQKPCQKKLGYKRGDFPVCEQQSEQILTLPIHQYLKKENIYYTTDLVRKFYSNR